MKKIKNLIKLSNRNLEKLNKKEQSVVFGGEEPGEPFCCCGCLYSECGGSSTVDNGTANADTGTPPLIPIGQAEWNGAG